MRIRNREIALPIACQQEGGIINLFVSFQLTFGPSVDQLFLVLVSVCLIVDGLVQGFIARFDEVKEG